jgi:hypothetical protein
MPAGRFRIHRSFAPADDADLLGTVGRFKEERTAAVAIAGVAHATCRARANHVVGQPVAHRVNDGFGRLGDAGFGVEHARRKIAQDEFEISGVNFPYAGIAGRIRLKVEFGFHQGHRKVSILHAPPARDTHLATIGRRRLDQFNCRRCRGLGELDQSDVVVERRFAVAVMADNFCCCISLALIKIGGPGQDDDRTRFDRRTAVGNAMRRRQHPLWRDEAAAAKLRIGLPRYRQTPGRLNRRQSWPPRLGRRLPCSSATIQGACLVHGLT